MKLLMIGDEYTKPRKAPSAVKMARMRTATLRRELTEWQRLHNLLLLESRDIGRYNESVNFRRNLDDSLSLRSVAAFDAITALCREIGKRKD